MNRALLFALVLAAAPALADQSGQPLTPTFSVRGPFAHVVGGASLVTPEGAVLSAADASVDVPDGSAAVSVRLTWLGSAGAADADVDVIVPDGRAFSLSADSCMTVEAGPLALEYFRCGADITRLFTSAPDGTFTVGSLEVETGEPWASAQGHAGGFAVVVVYADAGDVRPRVLQLAEGLLWSKLVRTSSPALLPFAAAESAGKMSVVAIEGDAELPGDGECVGAVDASCDFVGLCRGNACEDVVVAGDGNVFDESSGDAFDVDTFDLAGRLPSGNHEDLRMFVQTGSDAVLQALAVVEVPDVDVDGDGLADAAELAVGTDPARADSDGDGIADGTEFYGRSPGAPSSVPTNPLSADTDGDGLEDGEEDVDFDGLRDAGETSGADDDSDDDGVGDGVERGSCSDPLDIDSDDDGLGDGEEDANANGAVDDSETSPCVFDAPPPAPVLEEPTVGDVVELPPVQGEPPEDVVVRIVVTEPPTVGSPPRPSASAVDGGELRVVEELSPEQYGELSGSTVWGCASSTSAAPVGVIGLAMLLRRRRR